MDTYLVDAFTQLAFRGNPAGVCFPEKALSAGQMLRIAQELRHSETAFVQLERCHGAYPIRYFSPKTEIPLCGHATIAAAKVLHERSGLSELTFRNINELDIPVSITEGAIRLTLPAYQTQQAQAPEALLDALGLTQVVNVAYNSETNILLLEIRDPDELRMLEPDFEALSRSHSSINGVVVTAPSKEGGFDFHSRYFWPWSGTNEDPVTGGTHTFLAGYWAERLGKQTLRSFQASRRTGSLQLQLFDNMLWLTGHAVIVLSGRLRQT